MCDVTVANLGKGILSMIFPTLMKQNFYHNTNITWALTFKEVVGHSKVWWRTQDVLVSVQHDTLWRIQVYDYSN